MLPLKKVTYTGCWSFSDLNAISTVRSKKSIRFHRFGVRFMYATRTLGVDPGYVSEGFYRRVLDKDDSRVNKRFREAAANGVTVEQRTCLIQEMCDHLQNHGPCIVLVNANILRCRAEDHMGQKKASLVLDGRNLFSCCSSSSAVKSSSYQGHFILAVGFDATSEVVTFHNPSRKEGTCATSFHNFDEARTSYGTDEDVIFIYSNK